MARILRDSTSTIVIQLFDNEGEPVTEEDVTADIHDSAGVLVQEGLEAQEDPEDSGRYVITPDPISVLDTYSVNWQLPEGQNRHTEFEVVGGFLFAVEELRSEYEEVKVKTADQIRKARVEAEDIMETFGQVAFRPKGRRARVAGGGRALRLEDMLPIKVVSVGGFETEDLEGLELHAHGKVESPSKSFPASTEILYEHGYPSTPAPVRKAAMQLAVEKVMGRASPSRAISEQTSMGFIRLGTASVARGRWTGIPDVDAVIDEWGKRRSLIA